MLLFLPNANSLTHRKQFGPHDVDANGILAAFILESLRRQLRIGAFDTFEPIAAAVE